MITKSRDEIILALQEQVNTKRAQIAKLEKPDWKTSCTFRETPNSQSLNIHVISDLDILKRIAGLLVNYKNCIIEGAKVLDIPAGDCKYDGYKVEDWLSDIKVRVAKINISSEKSKLAAIEERLAKLESPELKAQRELDELQKMLQS